MIIEGCITEVMESSFSATLITDDNQEAYAEIDNDKFSAEDQLLIKVGQLFFWFINDDRTYSFQMRR